MEKFDARWLRLLLVPVYCPIAPQDTQTSPLQEWCESIGIITDEEGVSVQAIKAWDLGQGEDGLVPWMGI